MWGQICTSFTDTTLRVWLDNTFRVKLKGRKVEYCKGRKLLKARSLASHQAKQRDIYQLFVLEENEKRAAIT